MLKRKLLLKLPRNWKTGINKEISVWTQRKKPTEAKNKFCWNNKNLSWMATPGTVWQNWLMFKTLVQMKAANRILPEWRSYLFNWKTSHWKLLVLLVQKHKQLYCAASCNHNTNRFKSGEWVSVGSMSVRVRILLSIIIISFKII